MSWTMHRLLQLLPIEKAAQDAATIHEGLPVSFTLDATSEGQNSIQDCAVPWPQNVAAQPFTQVGLRPRGNIY
jgi:hypothetical protein